MHARFPTLLTLLGLALAWSAQPAAGQLPPLTVPRGYVRFEIGGHFTGYDERFYLGQRQDAAGDFIRDAVAADFFPTLAEADALIQRITGLPTTLSLGRTSASHLVTIGSGRLGAAVGISSRLTVFGAVPLRLVKVRASLTQDSITANAGFNPADPVFGDGAGEVQDALFFSQFDQALAQLDQNLTGGLYDGDPARKALAQSTLASASTLRADLFTLLLGGGLAPFLPTGSSSAGAAILQRIAVLQGVLVNGLDVPGFTAAPAFPAERLDDAGFNRFITSPQGPVAGSLDTPEVTALGDVEVGVAYAVLDQLSAPGARSGFRITAQVLARLPTAQLADPNRFFSAGTGDRQLDLEGSAVADLVKGRFGGRLSAGYNLQLAGSALRRISPPSQPIAYLSTLAEVSRNPGDELVLGATPFFRITPTFAFVAGATYRSKGIDRYALATGQDSIPGAPADLLGFESDWSSTTATAGFSYSTILTPREGRKAQAPLDAGLMWEGVVGGSGGRVPKSSAVRLWLRLYARFW